MVKTPCNVVTGFLGAGKTTLLRRVMAGELQAKRVALIMNEIGDVGVDAEVVTDLDGVEAMVELNSGCVCCTINEYAFQMAFREIQATVKPELIIIETTGLADPWPLLSRLRTVAVAQDAVITLVDALNFEAMAVAEPVLAEQVKAADFLVVSKLDLVEPAVVDALKQRLRTLNPRALIVESSQGCTNADLLFGTSVARYRQRTTTLAPGPLDQVTGATAHLTPPDSDGIDVFSYRTDNPIRLAPFKKFLETLPTSLYRAKGSLKMVNSADLRLFNYTCGRVDLQSLPGQLVPKNASTQAVFIGRGLGPVSSRIIAGFQACEEIPLP